MLQRIKTKQDDEKKTKRENDVNPHCINILKSLLVLFEDKHQKTFKANKQIGN